MISEIKLRCGAYKYPVAQIEFGGRYYFKFNYNKGLLEEIKAMQGAKWHGYENNFPPEEVRKITGEKVWSIPISNRNLFQLEYLKGNNPYAPYDKPLAQHDILGRHNQENIWIDPYSHQKEMIAFVLSRHYCILAAEMGTGKTLVAIYVMEIANLPPEDEIWYVAPRSALKSVEREFRVWKCKIKPKFLTYDELVKLWKVWDVEGRPRAPRMVFFDESSRVKNPTAQRSQAAYKLAEAVREDWRDQGYVIEMSGSPAPKAPTDWWHQCEVACPGYLKEGTWEKCRNRLGLIVERENTTTGGIFPQLVTWKDSEDKCHICGKSEAEHALQCSPEELAQAHAFVKAKNEVTLLYERMKGLVLVKFKKDCLRELPDKIYRTIRLKPTPDMLRAAKLISASSVTMAEKLTRLRELSDGFQYTEVVDGQITCPRCNGSKVCKEMVAPDGMDPETAAELCAYKEVEIDCPNCGATGSIDRIIRTAEQIETPKEPALRELLDEHEDVGRIVIYAGFQGSVDRCEAICQSEKWAAIRWDGRGIKVVDQNGAFIVREALDVFQDLLEQYPRTAFIGQPGAAGMGLTLTRSPTICYWSNDFNAESRIQSEDRIHRPGMDINKGATIIDLCCLPSDYRVLENLKQKRKLQQMTLDGIDWNTTDERLF